MRNKLRVSRKARNLKAVELASISKVTSSRISLIEHGWVEPTDNERIKLANALKMPIEKVFPVKTFTHAA